MSLMCALLVSCKRTVTPSRTNRYQNYIKRYVGRLTTLYPNTQHQSIHHVAFHIYDFLILFGPVHSWWCFPFERLIGHLQRIPHNHRFGKPTVAVCRYRTFVRASNLRRWLLRCEAPDFIKRCAALFTKIYSSKSNADPAMYQEGLESEKMQLQEMPPSLRPLLPGQSKTTLSARLRAHDLVYSRASTHLGNSMVMFYPEGNHAALPVPGSIHYIFKKGGVMRFAVRRYLKLPPGVYDPFSRWPDFPASLWSSRTSEALEKVKVDNVYSQFVQYAVSEDSIVLLSLSKVCSATGPGSQCSTVACRIDVGRQCTTITHVVL